MYHQYFGLSEAPFSIAVNPRYLFMSARHRDALAHLLYGVGAGGGFILLTGEVGTGKTTINRCLLEQLPEDTDIAIILNPALNATELLASACDELGIAYDEPHTLKSLTDSLHKYLLENHARGRRTVLLIDEAQHLDFEVMEQIRLLTNLETNSEKLLQIILIGQPELAQKLARPELRQLSQRITARYNLEPLNQEETDAYIRHRLQVAGLGSNRTIFPAPVVAGIYRATRGIPRLINVLCDRMLLGAYGRNKYQADQAMLRQAVEEVLGDDASTTPGSVWHWPLAVFGGLCLVLLLVLVGGQFLLGPGVPAPANSGLSPQVSASQVQAEGSESSPSVEPPAQMATEPEQTAAASSSVPTATTALLGVGESMSLLWSLYVDIEVDSPACTAQPREGVICSTGEDGTWDDLARLRRPISLEMKTPERFSAEALLLTVESGKVWLYTNDGLSKVEQAALQPLWTGTYRYLWHVPNGFSGLLSPGDDSPVVTELALLFARLDGQPVPLATGFFNNALQQRVRLFQRSQGLQADGVVGVQTLLALNRELGIDPSPESVMERLKRSSDEDGS